ncbi:hypothetical protein CDAR_306291 [Caerostris darwini]|uniref:Uncharacterized protein n=1 Tax=Caerostris darwini TaxID=1538125 RepID=A0AAV4SWZ3_9ARAC|nr:hypothetical protein CDAR_306291 [Caerostris darwini]
MWAKHSRMPTTAADASEKWPIRIATLCRTVPVRACSIETTLTTPVPAISAGYYRRCPSGTQHSSFFLLLRFHLNTLSDGMFSVAHLDSLLTKAPSCLLRGLGTKDCHRFLSRQNNF